LPYFSILPWAPSLRRRIDGPVRNFTPFQ
jgi:hypothetical protein